MGDLRDASVIVLVECPDERARELDLQRGIGMETVVREEVVRVIVVALVANDLDRAKVEWLACHELLSDGIDVRERGILVVREFLDPRLDRLGRGGDAAGVLMDTESE